MKKIFYLVGIIAALIMAACATQDDEGADVVMEYDKNTVIIQSLSSADTLGAGDSVWTSETVRNKSESRLFVKNLISLDSTGGAIDTVAISLQYKAFTNSGWTEIATVNWAAGTDTIKELTTTTAVNGEFFRTVATCEDDDFMILIDENNYSFKRE